MREDAGTETAVRRLSLSYSIWAARMWLGERLLRLGGWVEPEHRYNHRYNADGTITIWTEPVR